MTATTSAPASPDTGRELVDALRRAGIADVDDSGLARALYSSDASLYRVLPRAVVRPRHADEMLATLEVCRSLGVPLTARGAGTSIAGNAVGPGVVLDTSRYLSAVRAVDPEARTATVEPGLVQAALQTAARPAGLRFGPDPSTHNRCTIGGMIGNNACGSRALGYGRTSDNVVGLDVDHIDPRQVAAGVQDDAGADGVAGDRRPRPPRGQGHAEGAAHLERRDDLVGVLRSHHRAGEDPVERGVGGVERAGQPGTVDVGEAGAAQGGEQLAVDGGGAAHHRSIERR